MIDPIESPQPRDEYPAAPGVPLENLNRDGRRFRVTKGMMLLLAGRRYEVTGITPGATRITLTSRGRATADGQ